MPPCDYCWIDGKRFSPDELVLKEIDSQLSGGGLRAGILLAAAGAPTGANLAVDDLRRFCAGFPRGATGSQCWRNLQRLVLVAFSDAFRGNWELALVEIGTFARPSADGSNNVVAPHLRYYNTGG